MPFGGFMGNINPGLIGGIQPPAQAPGASTQPVKTSYSKPGQDPTKSYTQSWLSDQTGVNLDVVGGVEKALSGKGPQVAIPGQVPVDQGAQQMTQRGVNEANLLAQQGQVNNPFRQAQLAQVQAGNPLSNALLQQQQNQNLQNALSLAASTRGNVNPALMQRQVANQVAQGNQAAIQQAQLGGLQEQAQQAQLAGQARQQDIGYETSLRNLAQQYMMMGMDANKALLQAQTQLQAAQLGANSAAQQSANQASMGMFGGLMNAVGSGIALLSDETQKTNITSGKKDVLKFLDAVSAKKYEYKNKAFGEKTYVSPMAQELEKTALGKQMVVDTPNGKMVDYRRGLASMIATNAVLHERIKKLEKKG